MYTGKLIEADDIRAEGREEGRVEGLEQGRKEGLVEGRKEGLVEGRLKARRYIVGNMRAEGFSDVLIREITGLSDEELQQLHALNS